MKEDTMTFKNAETHTQRYACTHSSVSFCKPVNDTVGILGTNLPDEVDPVLEVPGIPWFVMSLQPSTTSAILLSAACYTIHVD
jgi:hypothetical protein